MNDPQAHSEIARVAAEEHPYDEGREVSRLAHEYYQQRNGDGGSAEDDWYRAEREVRSRRGSER